LNDKKPLSFGEIHQKFFKNNANFRSLLIYCCFVPIVPLMIGYFLEWDRNIQREADGKIIEVNEVCHKQCETFYKVTDKSGINKTISSYEGLGEGLQVNDNIIKKKDTFKYLVNGKPVMKYYILDIIMYSFIPLIIIILLRIF
jgi:hypothetical protein